MSKLPTMEFLQSRMRYNERNDTIWANLSCNSHLPIEYVRLFKDRLNWRCLSRNNDIAFDEDFFDEFKDYIDWGTVSRCQLLTDAMIIKYADKIDFQQMAKWNHISEKILERFGDRMDWGDVSYRQAMSDQFIKKYRHKLSIEMLGSNPFLSRKFKIFLDDLSKEGKFHCSNYYEGVGMKEKYLEGVKLFNSLPEVDDYFNKVK
jgi:hypothetical protein